MSRPHSRGYSWRTGRDPHALAKAMARYQEGHRLTDCARRYKVGVGELLAELKAAGLYRRGVTP